MFAGSNMGNGGWAIVQSTPAHGRPASIAVTPLLPLAVVVFKPEG